jgi:hypothetical protein
MQIQGSRSAVIAELRAGGKVRIGDAELGSGLWEKVKVNVGRLSIVLGDVKVASLEIPLGVEPHYSVVGSAPLNGPGSGARFATEIGGKKDGKIQGFKVYENDGRQESINRSA